MDSGCSDILAKEGTPASNIATLEKPVKIRIAKSSDFILAKRTGDIEGIPTVDEKTSNFAIQRCFISRKS